MKLFKAKSIILGVLMASSVIGAAALEIYLDYRDTETRAYKASSDVTLVVEQQMKDTVRSVENLIDTNAKTIIEAGNLKVVNNKKYFYELKSDCISIQGCEVVAIADPNGDLVLDTAYESSIDKSFINISDRQYFKKSIEEKKLFIGPAIVSRLPNHQILFNIAKPVFDKNGKLLAVITMGIKTSHLTGFYSLLGFGFSPTIAVYKKMEIWFLVILEWKNMLVKVMLTVTYLKSILKIPLLGIMFLILR